MNTLAPSRLLSQGQLSFAFLMLMLCVPFLNPHHRNPIPSFFPEWWAAILGLAAGGALLLSQKLPQVSLPKIALLPALLSVLIFLQLAWHPGASFELSLLAALYLLWAIFMMGLGSALANAYSKNKLADTMATGILLGALLSTLVVALQWQGSMTNTFWVNAKSSERLFGNVNQPNHLALQLWMGIAALLHLQRRKHFNWPLATAAMILLVFASLLTGSRALWLYAGGLVVLATLLNRKQDAPPSLLPGAVLAFAATAGGKVLLPLLNTVSGNNSTGPVGWVQQGSDGVRGGLWWIATQMGAEMPWQGIGWGHFSSASYARIEHYRALAPNSLTLVPGEHAHNITLNLFAELGILAPLLLLLCLGLWLRRVWRHEITPPAAFSLCLLLFLGLHAQLEYTLWYAYFLGIAALALTLSDPGQAWIPPLRRSLVGIVLCAALAALLLLRIDYQRLEQAMHWRSRGENASNVHWEDVIKDLVDLRQHSQFGRYVDLAMIGAMPLNRDALRGKLTLCEHGIDFSPTHYAVFKCAALRALNGEPELAKTNFLRALASYPEKTRQIADELSGLTSTYPELGPLLVASQTKPPNKTE